jgi:hypothetical protein
MLFAPFRLVLRADPARTPPPSFAALMLLRWLLFRVMFMSGVVKLSSHDPAWRDLTAMGYHYWTQPLPTWTSWWMHQSPLWMHKLAAGGTFVIELIVPLLFFGPRRLRLLACWLTIALQLTILATGNYGFFNLLTIALCLPLIDDAFFKLRTTHLSNPAPSGSGMWRIFVAVPVAALILFVTALQVIDGFTRDQRFFLSFARVWRSQSRDEWVLNIVKSDPHAPEQFRAIAAPSNMREFAKAFSCKAGDPMVRDDEKRVVIW